METMKFPPYAKITLDNYTQYRDMLDFLKVRVVRKLTDNLLLLSQTTTKKKFLLGKIKCPYCSDEIELPIIFQLTPGGPSFEQFISDFINHMDKHEQFEKEWLYRSKQPYQQGSWHRVKYFVCRKCDYKSRRLTDVLIHIITKHKFALK